MGGGGEEGESGKMYGSGLGKSVELGRRYGREGWDW